MKEFKGRVLFKGNLKGEAVVTSHGFNTLASFQKSLLSKSSKSVVVSNQNNPDLFKKEITGKILCLPQTIGSTTGGLVLQTAARRGLAPAAMLFADEIDPLAASGVILSNVWEKVPLICIDGLGREFLDTVKTGDQIEIKEDGTVVIL